MNTPYSDGLRPQEYLAVEGLAKGRTCRSIATELGITERALYNWRKKPAVQRAVLLRQQELIEENESQSIELMPDAISTLKSIMQDPTANPMARIAASRALLHGASAYQERMILHRQIRDLEDQVKPQGFDQTPPEDEIPHFTDA